MRYPALIDRARILAAALLPEPELLAPQTPADLVTQWERAADGATLGGLTAEQLDDAGGLAAWRELIIRCVAERAEPLAPVTYAAIGTDGTRYVVWGLGASEETAEADARAEADAAACDPELRCTVAIGAERVARIQAGDVSADDLVTS